jgi:hypothetical protein
MMSRPSASRPGGFSDAQGAFTYNASPSLLGDVRRFGPYGPAYEVIADRPGADVTVRVIESGETLAYPRTDVLVDPIAETIP